MHVFLIMARSVSEELKNLLTSLDYENNDIYLHIDAKNRVEHLDINNYCVHADLTIVNSIKVSWAAYSQIKTELVLLKAAVQSPQKYEYIHLLSENDLPVKSNEALHNYFKIKNTEFIEVTNTNDEVSLEKIKYYYILQEFVGKKHGLIWLAQKILVLFEKVFRINRLNKLPYMMVAKRPNYFSITENFAQYILHHEAEIGQFFSSGRSADEIFLQTLLLDSNFKQNISSSVQANFRYVRWKHENSPDFLTVSEDFKEISSNQNLVFARKFSTKVIS